LTTADSIAEFQETARKMFGAQSDAFLKLYPAKSDADVRRVAHEAAREMGFLRNSQACASMQAKYNQSPTFIELFARKHPYVPGVTIADQDPATIGAYHTADVPYWFGTLDAFNSLRPTRNWIESDRSLSQLMMASLITFAQTGSPASKELPWPAWSQANQQMMVFGDGARIEKLPVARMDWLAAHPPADVPRTGKRAQRAIEASVPQSNRDASACSAPGLRGAPPNWRRHNLNSRDAPRFQRRSAFRMHVNRTENIRRCRRDHRKCSPRAVAIAIDGTARTAPSNRRSSWVGPAKWADRWRPLAGPPRRYRQSARQCAGQRRHYALNEARGQGLISARAFKVTRKL